MAMDSGNYIRLTILALKGAENTYNKALSNEELIYLESAGSLITKAIKLCKEEQMRKLNEKIDIKR